MQVIADPAVEVPPPKNAPYSQVYSHITGLLLCITSALHQPLTHNRVVSFASPKRVLRQSVAATVRACLRLPCGVIAAPVQVGLSGPLVRAP